MTRIFALALTAFVIACGGSPEAPVPAPVAPAPEPPAPAEPPKAEPPVAAAPDPNEACGQIVVVAYKGAAHAADGVTRDKAAAATRAGELLAKVKSGTDFAALAQTESDAPSSAPRGGVMGTYVKAEWPELHGALRDPLFALGVGEVAPAPVEADYGFVILRRCPVEKAHSRHILVRYKGAKKAGPEIKRGKEAAAKRAAELLAQLTAGKDFAELARAESDDSSKERGGDVGLLGRGLLALPYEQALFALQPGQRSGVVETDFGFHILERMED
jgi:parvulin-like peptidyl-prolyl isomerase